MKRLNKIKQRSWAQCVSSQVRDRCCCCLASGNDVSTTLPPALPPPTSPPFAPTSTYN